MHGFHHASNPNLHRFSLELPLQQCHNNDVQYSQQRQYLAIRPPQHLTIAARNPNLAPYPQAMPMPIRMPGVLFVTPFFRVNTMRATATAMVSLQRIMGCEWKREGRSGRRVDTKEVNGGFQVEA